ncbi:MAG TPA: sensor histidine kinase [Flavobacteriales bacterium]|mgnify:CR=1 FL=1|nr:sensor histidine kinase [Flavobacteriales bacterium]
MSARATSDRWLIAFFVGTLIVAFGTLAWSYRQVERRETDLAELALARNQMMVTNRLDALFRMTEEDLKQEARAVAYMDTTDRASVLERWQPLLDAHWEISAIRLADELGNELALSRQGTGLMWLETREGSRNSPPLVTLLDVGSQAVGVPDRPMNDTVHDPRQRIWFSRSLEIGSREPVWTLRRYPDDKAILQVSLLIRNPGPDQPHQVMMFDIDLSRSNTFHAYRADLGVLRSILLDDEGSPLVLMEPTDSLTRLAVEQARETWSQVRSRRTFRFSLGSKDHLGTVTAYPLNGAQLLLGNFLDLDAINLWTGPERRMVLLFGLFLTILSGLLLATWRVRAVVRKRMRKQQRTNRNLQRKLAKAIGERDVLNREVHHRVKNNLQVVSSLLNLQASRLQEGPVRQEFLRGKRRIDTIALVHHKLYGSKDLRNVDLQTFFGGLIDSLNEMHRPISKAVSHTINVHGLVADQDTAIELGIIVCELVSNAYQHAFPHATGGHIDIGLQQVEGGLYRLLVKNNGKGLPTDYREGSGKLGLEIVDALASQLDGSFHIRTNGSVAFEVLFRMLRDSASPDPVTGDVEPNE